MIQSYYIEFAIFQSISSKLLGFYEIINCYKINKHFKYYTQTYINNFYYIIKKTFYTKMILHNNYYHNQYWYSIFKQKLNYDELAFYYSSFIFKYQKFWNHTPYSKLWTCILFPDGFIKSFDINCIKQETDTIFNVILYYKLSYFHEQKIFKLYYWKTDVSFFNYKGIQIYPENFNFKLIQNIIINHNFNNIITLETKRD